MDTAAFLSFFFFFRGMFTRGFREMYEDDKVGKEKKALCRRKKLISTLANFIFFFFNRKELFVEKEGLSCKLRKKITFVLMTSERKAIFFKRQEKEKEK